VKIYLDASALNRPFDDHTVPRNRLEAEAMLVILDGVERRRLELVSSSVLEYENRMNPFGDRREYVATYLSLAKTFVRAGKALLDRAREIESAGGLAPLDALHLASAERAKAEWFVTCDDGILKRARSNKLALPLKVGTPIAFSAARRKGDG